MLYIKKPDSGKIPKSGLKAANQKCPTLIDHFTFYRLSDYLNKLLSKSPAAFFTSSFL